MQKMHLRQCHFRVISAWGKKSPNFSGERALKTAVNITLDHLGNCQIFPKWLLRGPRDPKRRGCYLRHIP
jgi:hypothetical protein